MRMLRFVDEPVYREGLDFLLEHQRRGWGVGRPRTRGAHFRRPRTRSGDSAHDDGRRRCAHARISSTLEPTARLRVKPLMMKALPAARVLRGDVADQRAGRSSPSWICALLVSACGRPVDRPFAVPDPPALVTSNILHDDYAGSKKCGDCHGAIYEVWKRSPMHRMTRLANGGAIVAPFDGATLRIGSDMATMETRDGKRYVTLDSSRDGRHVYRVTKVIGGRYREDYVGVDVTTRPIRRRDGCRADPAGDLRVRDASVALQGLLRDGPRAERAPRSGSVEQDLHRLPQHAARDHDALRRASGSGCTVIPRRAWRRSAPAVSPMAQTRARRAGPRVRGRRRDRADRRKGAERVGAVPEGLAQAIAETRTNLGGGDLVELGVGCEACHNGAAEHVSDPSADAIVRGAKPARASRRTEARTVASPVDQPHLCEVATPCCSRATRTRGKAASVQTESRRQHDELRRGPRLPARRLRVADGVHDLPRSARRRRRGGSDRGARDARRQRGLRDVPSASSRATHALAAHSQHTTGSAGTSCIGCHMPKKNMGLDYELVRYHRIGSPTDEQRVRGDRPLECALCHAGQEREASSSSTMERWWGKRYDADALGNALRRRSRTQHADAATLARGKPHEQAVAIARARRAARSQGACPRSLRTSRTRIRSSATTRSARSRS